MIITMFITYAILQCFTIKYLSDRWRLLSLLPPMLIGIGFVSAIFLATHYDDVWSLFWISSPLFGSIYLIFLFAIWKYHEKR